MLEPFSFALPVAATFLLAGLVKGVIGMGMPTVAMGLLGLLMPPTEAAALLILPSLVTNLWQLLAGPDLRAAVRRLGPTMLAVAAATLAASGLIAQGDRSLATLSLGAALAAYALLGLLRWKLSVPPQAERWVGPLAGAATGLLTGATGVFVIPAVPYLAGLGLGREEFVQALGLSFTVSTLALGLGLLLHGALPLQAAGASLGAVLPALAGMSLGAALRGRIDPEAFRLCFFAALLALGFHLVWQAAG